MSHQKKPGRSYRKRAEPGAEASETSPGDVGKNLCGAEKTGIAQQLPEKALAMSDRLRRL
jgi:hypothetical protein